MYTSVLSSLFLFFALIMKLKKKVGRANIELANMRNEKLLTTRLNPNDHNEDDDGARNQINDSSDSMMENPDPYSTNSPQRATKTYAGMAPISHREERRMQ